jgi:predicted small metal-binding protein
MVEKLIECDCGWTCRGGEEELVAACTAHARQVHGLELTREQVLAAARPVDRGDDENPTPAA